MSNKTSVEFKDYIIQFLEDESPSDPETKLMSEEEEAAAIQSIRSLTLEEIEDVTCAMGIDLDSHILEANAFFDYINDTFIDNLSADRIGHIPHEDTLVVTTDAGSEYLHLRSFVDATLRESSPCEKLKISTDKYKSEVFAALETRTQEHRYMGFRLFMEECREAISAMMRINEPTSDYYVEKSPMRPLKKFVRSEGIRLNMTCNLNMTINEIELLSNFNAQNLARSEIDSDCQNVEWEKWERADEALMHKAKVGDCSINPAFVKEVTAVANHIKLHKPRKSNDNRN